MNLKYLEICLKIYKIDPAKLLSAPGLAWQAALKKAKLKLDLLTDTDMLLMVEKDYNKRNIQLHLSILKR